MSIGVHLTYLKMFKTTVNNVKHTDWSLSVLYVAMFHGYFSCRSLESKEEYSVEIQ